MLPSYYVAGSFSRRMVVRVKPVIQCSVDVRLSLPKTLNCILLPSRRRNLLWLGFCLLGRYPRKTARTQLLGWFLSACAQCYNGKDRGLTITSGAKIGELLSRRPFVFVVESLVETTSCFIHRKGPMQLPSPQLLPSNRCPSR